jgi:hypothetical protein
MSRYTAVLAFCFFSGVLIAADHIDSPSAVADPAADILDFYAFMNPQCVVMGGAGCEAEPEELVLALTVNPFATSETRFSDAVVYHIYFENDAGTTTQIDCSVSFDQMVTCAGLDGLSVTAPVGEIGENGDIRVFAGLRDDPFFLDFEAFTEFQTVGLSAFSAPGTDFFAGANVLAIVVGIKNASFPAGSGTVDSAGAPNNVQKVWAASERTKGNDIDGTLTGSWFNPAQNGQGWVIEVTSTPSGNDQFLVYFYGYDDAGQQLWLLGTTGDINGTQVTVDVIRFAGMGFGGGFDPNSVSNEIVGTMTFDFSDCNNATVNFLASNAGLTDFMTDMQRLSSISNAGCTDITKGQIDREGRPAISALISAGNKDAYNAASDPSAWAGLFQTEISTSLSVLDLADGVPGNRLVDPLTLAGLLADDRLQVDLEWAACPSYLGIEFSDLVPQPHTNDCGGRGLTQNVIDDTLSVVVSGFNPVVTDFVDANDVPFLTEFPFLAPPN